MSIYAGHKDVLINSYEGSVLIEDIPNSIKKDKLIDIARYELQNKSGRPLANLNNVTYKVNPNNPIDKINSDITVKYDNVK